MRAPRILAMVMAGGEGKRLYPLTAERSKPAVPFGGRYRIVDFVLSNLVNSGVHAIYLLVQYKSQSLIEHVRRAWVTSPITPDHFITVVPPQMGDGSMWFQGTADAVYQNLNLVVRAKPDLVAVFGADHIYRMDIGEMARAHRETGADVTVAATTVPLGKGGSFGVMGVDADARVRSFAEKPDRPAAMPNDPACCLASMGNYLFNTDVLIGALEASHRRKEQDFGRDVLPRLIESSRVYAYDFASRGIPGLRAYEEAAYWRDVGTIDEYFVAHQDLLGWQPRLDLSNPSWPIYCGSYVGPVAKIVSGQIENSVFGDGTIVNGARIANSVIRKEVTVNEGAILEDCIIMDYSTIGRGAQLRRTIVDRFATVDPGTVIGHDRTSDKSRYYVSESGVVVMSKNWKNSARK